MLYILNTCATFPVISIEYENVLLVRSSSHPFNKSTNPFLGRRRRLPCGDRYSAIASKAKPAALPLGLTSVRPKQQNYPKTEPATHKEDALATHTPRILLTSRSFLQIPWPAEKHFQSAVWGSLSLHCRVRLVRSRAFALCAAAPLSPSRNYHPFRCSESAGSIDLS